MYTSLGPINSLNNHKNNLTCFLSPVFQELFLFTVKKFTRILQSNSKDIFSFILLIHSDASNYSLFYIIS